MMTKPEGSLDQWTAPATAAFEFWASFWPTAPIFGVEWRFADSAMKWNSFIGITETTPANPASPAPAEVSVEVEVEAEAVAVEPAAETVEPAVEFVEAAIEPAVEAAEAPAVDEPEVPASLMVVAPEATDDLTRIKGVGAGLARQLNGLGVYKLEQIAGFTEQDLAWVDANLRSFKGRCFRDDWIGQARALIS